VGNKLYLMGGGWDALTVNSQFPVKHRCAVAASFKVPWNETNQRHNVEIEIATQDGDTLAKAGGQFEVGRPAGIPAGQNQRWQLALNLDMGFEQPGTFVIIARAEGQEMARSHFNVVPGPMLQMQQQKGA
jgi:hypothetical protein